MKKPMTVAEAGRKGGRKGGQSTSPAKQAAVRRNLEKARARKKLLALTKAV